MTSEAYGLLAQAFPLVGNNASVIIQQDDAEAEPDTTAGTLTRVYLSFPAFGEERVQFSLREEDGRESPLELSILDLNCITAEVSHLTFFFRNEEGTEYTVIIYK